MKPLARWTIGPTCQIGRDILKESVRLFARAYPEFDRVVCYNHIERPELADVEFYQQTEGDSPCPLAGPDADPERATGCGWKLSPPRLRPDAHELFIDNDIVIRQRLPAIDRWLSEESGLVSEGLHRQRMFGAFDGHIPPHVRACAGLFGLPPGFDFAERIGHYWPLMLGDPLGGYDEQGLTVATVVNMGRYVLVPLEELFICEDHAPFPQTTPPALHFVAANRKPWHRGWVRYRSRMIGLL